MTDRRRDPLPEGYRFGDAGKWTTYYAARVSVQNPTGCTVGAKRQWISPVMNPGEPLPPRETWHELKPLAFTTDRDTGDEA